MEKTTTGKSQDGDLQKGAFEDAGRSTQTSMQAQLPRRESNTDIKDHDSDFPEPGNNPEHSGQKEINPEAIGQTDEPGFSQKTNQNWRKEDLLAS